MRIGVIGPGRLGTGLARLLADRGYALPAVAGKTPAHAETLAAALPDCKPTTVQAVADTCDLVFITTPDNAINAVARAVTWQRGQGVVHCSGALPAAVLSVVEQHGALPGAFHPLQTLPDAQAAFTNLPGTFVAIEAEEPLLGQLAAIAAALECTWGYVPPDARPAYHAAAVLVSNYTVALTHAGVALWRAIGKTEAEALQALVTVATRHRAQPPPPWPVRRPHRPRSTWRLADCGEKPPSGCGKRSAAHAHVRCNGTRDDIQ